MTDLMHLKSISDWLAEDNELPSSGDACCVLEAVEEIERLRAAMQEAADMIRRCDYTPARSALLTALAHNAAVSGA